MSLQTVPALSGSESVVGIARETGVWGVTPVVGVDPAKTISNEIFFPIKEENIQPNFSAEPQVDDMSANREISRVIVNGGTNKGALRLIPGPESIGYFFTMLFGTPTTSLLAAASGTAPAVYQHFWKPGLNTRSNWPAPYSIESQFAATRSKLIRGALLDKLDLSLPNNAAMTITPDFMAKNMIWLGTGAGGMGSGTVNEDGETRPAVMTATPTLLSETEWHFKQLKAYPQIDGVDEFNITSLDYSFEFPGMVGLFTAGSGINLGNYRVDIFQLSGKVVMCFEDETHWYQFQAGKYFSMESVLTGDIIQGAYANKLDIKALRAKATSNNTVNKVGPLEYDFGWTGSEDPVTGHSCEVTLINTVSSYAT